MSLVVNGAVVAGLAVVVLVGLLRPPEVGRDLLRRPPGQPGQPGRSGRRVGPGSGGQQRVLVSAAAGLATGALVASVWALLVAPVVGVAAWFWLGQLDDAGLVRRRRRLAEQLPEVLGLLASALSAGSPTRVAIDDVAAVSLPESRAVLESVGSHLRVGRSEQEAWQQVADDPALAPVWGGPARDLARNATSGAAVVEVLQVHATQARANHRGEVEKQARTVGIRSVLPLMTCFLPAFVLVGVVPIIAGLVSSYLP
ncbi:type II secretion system F family protein [Propionibacteriaceae bacterium Y1923]|uniref:type II secretion system F family protein n=1 Tax=Aestuariimicrobium sp. Y1814 TaxID=3418742 RepID=UPI003C150939